MQGKNRISTGTILAVLAGLGTLIGVVSGILGIVGFFGVSAAPAHGLTDEQIVATLSALQNDKDRAELQLTQYAIQGQAAANDATKAAIDKQQANFQATLDAVNAQQDAFVATQNYFSGLTATADTVNAASTQTALDAGATQAAIAQVTQTPTPLPTATPPPAVVADYRSLTGADVRVSGKSVTFSVSTAETIPDAPQGVSYVWLLDTDRDPATGQSVQDIGVDLRVAIRYDNGAWIGTVRTIAADGSQGDPLFFVNIKFNGSNASASLDADQLGLPPSFDWLARSEGETEVYPFFPESGHLSLP